MCSYLRTKNYGPAATHLKTYSKAVNIAVSLLCMACPSMAFAYDFTLDAYGPNRVVSGHDLYVQETTAITEGTRDFVYYYVDGLPDGATVSWPTIEASCCGTNRGWQPGSNMVKISVPPAVPVGTYNLTLRAESGGIKKQIPYQLIVDPVPGPLPKQVISAIPPIPELSTWEEQMKTYGKQNCDQTMVRKYLNYATQPTIVVELGVWYYDGTRVYRQIADYTKDDYWNTCAGYIKKEYQAYVSAITMPGWRVFPHGLLMDYQDTNDETSKAAAIRLSTDSTYAKIAGGVIYGPTSLLRETAYIVNAYRIAGLLGSPNPTLYARAVDFLFGAIDQMFVSNTDPYLKPFMVGLMMEALIQYYDETKDPRVPPAVKAAADGLWARAWMPDSNAFYYESTATPLAAAPDLNLLIAPAYAWLYKLTGDPVYRQRGDLIFQGGVEGAWLSGGGKQFSQNYRWSFDYVNWRLHPDITPPAAPAEVKIKQ